MLNSRYRVMELLGDGTFGRVLLAKDREDLLAIKVIRDVERYTESAVIEANILEDIRNKDPEGKRSRSAIMKRQFMHGRHLCLVFEPCGQSLYDFLKMNGFRGFWLQDIQTMARQTMEALGFLHKTMKMTHTDLKPENILLQSMARPDEAEFPRSALWKPDTGYDPNMPYRRPVSAGIKLIDFGNATYEKDHHTSTISTRQYRAPEVILSLGWNELSDNWSVGCIFMELYTGSLLFGTHENLEHLALMEQTLKHFPSHMLEATRQRPFVHQRRDSSGNCRLNWPDGAQDEKSVQLVRKQRRLREMVVSGHTAFADFVEYTLTIDPKKRPSALETLSHEFFRATYAD